MTYLEALETELVATGIPAGRRRRILAEFADHLHEDPGTELGAPDQLARQFADELGTSLARAAAFRAFSALALAGVGLATMAAVGGGARGLGLIRHHAVDGVTWTIPILLIAAVASQVALAAGGLALLRAWRLRHRRVIGREDAVVLARRAAVGLLSGVVTVASLPAIALAYPHAAGRTWDLLAWVVAGMAVVALASVAPAVLRSARLRPASSGEPADLTTDLGAWLPSGMTPMLCALLLAGAIVVLGSFQGIVVDDPYDGILRGIADGTACLAGFAVLGRYLGLRTAR